MLRLVTPALFALLLAGAARAQDQAPGPSVPPPPDQSAPAAPEQGTEPENPPAAEQPKPSPYTPAPPPPRWESQQIGELVLLDKVSAAAQHLQIHVGETVKHGPLSITLRACDARPADEVADSTAYIDVTDANGEAPDFHGWIFASLPALNMYQHPGYDLTLQSCHS